MMSPYNQQINKLCNLFRHLWEGAAQRADQLADEESRQRRDGGLEDEENDSEELLDVQRGELKPTRPENMAMTRKTSRLSQPPQNEDIPKVPKRAASKTSDSKRENYEGYRKRVPGQYVVNNARQQREREERRYEREREKVRTERDRSDHPKEYLKMR